MIHLPELIQDLGVILATAAIVTILCKKLRQPVVLGYLIAGFMLGPHIPFLPSVTDTESVKVWAEIGVIFLLFGLGLEFSFKKLAQVGRSATVTAFVEIFSMLGIGYLVGQALNWSKMDSLFLGGILSISSTTIIVRAFDELNLKGRRFVSLVFGVLIVEDLVAILLLVLLSSVAVTQTFSGAELISSSLRLGFFMVLWFVLGIYLLPYFLYRAKKYLSDETMLVVSIGLCLVMVMVATKVGFSPALGAFVMGSILAETREGHRIEKLIMPVRDLFAAVFFVSVGMLLDPKVLQEHFWVIILLTVVTILGKFLSSMLGALLSGRSFKNSVQAGMSLAQIGEFSFIIATLGLTLKVTSDFLYPIAVAISALTTFTTPYMIKYADPFYFWLEKKIPANIRRRLEKYELGMSSASHKGSLSLVLDHYGLKILFNLVIVVAITIMVSRFSYFLPLENHSMADLLLCLIVLALCVPFLWAIMVATPREKSDLDATEVELLRRLQIGIQLVRFFIGSFLILFIVSQFVSTSIVVGFLLVVVSIAGIYFSTYAEPFYRKIEDRFISNLTQKERDELEVAARRPELAPWNATLNEFVVPADSPLVMKTLMQSGIREKFGVTIAMIERGSRKILAPGREDYFLPNDKIYAIGTDEQLIQIKALVDASIVQTTPQEQHFFGLTSVHLDDTHPLVGKSIRESQLRETVLGLVVGIERGGQRMLNPDSQTTLAAGDLIWLVGDLNKIHKMV